MKKVHARLSVIWFIFVVITLIGTQTSDGSIFTINPRATYLCAYPDPQALNATPINLALLDIHPGDYIRLKGLGDMSLKPDWEDDRRHMLGVFSSSSTLLSANLQNRVPGAIDAGIDIFTPSNYTGLPTDIVEDFLISSIGGFDSIDIQVPNGTIYIFVAQWDSYYSDNSDPDGDFAVEITLIPEPATLLLLALGGFALRKRIE